MTGCAVVVGAGAAVPGLRTKNHVIGVAAGYPMPRQQVWYWPGWLWAVTAGLALAGVVVAGRPSMSRRAAAVAAVLGAQIAGRGVVGVRDWFNLNGAGRADLAQNELATRVTVAATIAIAGTVAACVAGAVLWREPVRGWPALWRPRRPGLGALGAVVALAVPLTVLLLGGADAITEAGSLALTATLPWGCALVAAAWLGPRARRAVIGAVIACASVMAINFVVSLMSLAAIY
jgi:hypothetical protein